MPTIYIMRLQAFHFPALHSNFPVALIHGGLASFVSCSAQYAGAWSDYLPEGKMATYQQVAQQYYDGDLANGRYVDGGFFIDVGPKILSKQHEELDCDRA